MQRLPIFSGKVSALPPLALSTAFSMMTHCSPTVTGAPSAVTTAPCSTALPAPIVTSPLTIALGAT